MTVSAFEPRSVRVDGAEVVLRTAREEDAAMLLDFLRAVSATTEQVLTQPDEHPQTVEEERQKIREYTGPDRFLMLALAGPVLAGVLAIRSGQRRRAAHTAEFGITVAEPWRGRGVGTAMMRAMLAWAADHPVIEKVCLQVFSTNPRAMALYRTLGFVEEGRQEGQGRLGPGRYVDSIHMGVWVKARS